MNAAGAAARLALLFAVGLLGFPLQWLAVRGAPQASRLIPGLFHRAACRLLRVRIAVIGERPRERPVLILANHTSWLDIVVLSAAMPVVFVAKSEVAGWPVFGTLARLQRTVFVDRSRRHASAGAAREMGERLRGGDAVVLFPEGTSSDHGRVLPFRSALVGALQAQDMQAVAVQPVAINYTRIAGLPVGRRERPRIAWYGDMDLLPHLWALARCGGVDAELVFADRAMHAGMDRKRLAASAETAVRQAIAARRGHGTNAQAPAACGNAPPAC